MRALVFIPKQVPLPVQTSSCSALFTAAAVQELLTFEKLYQQNGQLEPAVSLEKDAAETTPQG